MLEGEFTIIINLMAIHFLSLCTISFLHFFDDRLYIGQLPLELTEGEVHAFFQNCIKVATGKDNESMDGDDDPILSVYINRERRFAFVVSI